MFSNYQTRQSISKGKHIYRYSTKSKFDPRGVARPFRKPFGYLPKFNNGNMTIEVRSLKSEILGRVLQNYLLDQFYLVVTSRQSLKRKCHPNKKTRMAFYVV